MASAPFPNIYTRRLVADTSARGCDICYKPSTTVLITPEKQVPSILDPTRLPRSSFPNQRPTPKDFFYVCAIHLIDRNFCSPIVDEAAIEAKKKKELEEEVERVKKEYEEKQKKKREKEKEKGKEKEKDKPAEEKGKDKDEDKKDEKKDEPPKSPKVCAPAPLPQLQERARR
jgi:hypothetical protein